MSATELDEALFDEFVSQTELQDNEVMPADLAETIKASLRKRFHSPPTAGLEACLGHPIFADEARRLLFGPSDEDMRLYPGLLRGGGAQGFAPEDDPQFKMMVVALTMLYMAHCHRLDRVRPFVEAGGLMSLVHLMAHSNLHVRSQATQSLLHITNEEVYPWHDPPVTEDGRGPAEGPDKLLWQRMFELSRSPLISNLLRLQPDVFPGSSLLALRLLAFYTSWLRYHFTPERVLRLSAELLETLKQWSQREELRAEEKELATKLYEDFSRFPPAEAPLAPQLGADAAQTTVGGGAADEEQEDACTRVVHDRTQVNSREPSEAERLKDEGNAAYREGLYTQAIQLYSEALDVPVPAAALLDEAGRRAVYHANRAAAYLGRAAAGPLREGQHDNCGLREGQDGRRAGCCIAHPCTALVLPHTARDDDRGLLEGLYRDCTARTGQYDDRGLLEGLEHGDPDALDRHHLAALMDADSALEMSPDHVRAHLRRAQALSKLGRTEEALAAARLGLKRAADSSGGVAPKGGSKQQQPQLVRELQGLVVEIQLQAAAAAAASVAVEQAPMQAVAQDVSDRLTAAAAEPASSSADDDILSQLAHGSAAQDPRPAPASASVAGGAAAAGPDVKPGVSSAAQAAPPSKATVAELDLYAMD